MKIIYLHGLGGAKETSNTYIQIKKYLGDKAIVLAPEVPHNAKDARLWVKGYLEEEKPDLIVSSSMGAFITLVSEYDAKTIVVNPAMGGFTDIITAFGLGYKGEFDLGRSNGDTTFILDQYYYDSLKEVTDDYNNRLFNNKIIRTNEIYGIFSYEDEFFHHKDDFVKYYSNNYTMIHDSHALSTSSIINYVIPKIKEMLNI